MLLRKSSPGSKKFLSKQAEDDSPEGGFCLACCVMTCATRTNSFFYGGSLVCHWLTSYDDHLLKLLL